MQAVDLSTGFWTPRAIHHALGGRWAVPPANPAAPLAGLCTDTRAVAPRQVFVALRGERFDAHDFLPAAADAGAALLIVGRPPAAELLGHPRRPAILQVPDTLAALQTLAWAYRDRLAQAGVRVIAVVGSNGKTTTRHLLHSVLQHAPARGGAALRGSQSPRSYNNHIGVPLTLLAACPDHDYLALEIGSNHPGEIDALARIARPDDAVITHIGREHLEFFGDLAAVAREEAAVLAHLRRGGNVFVARPAEPHVAPMLAARPDLVVTVYDAHDPALPDHLPLPGAHNRLNAAAAAAVARALGVPDGHTRARLASAQAIDGRLQVLRFGLADAGVTVIHDAYNANPDSMAAALGVLAEQPGTRRVAVLGDMLELGHAGPDLHRAVGEQIARTPAIDEVILIGRLSMFIAQALGRADPARQTHVLPQWADRTPADVVRRLAPGDAVLLKASLGMGLHRLLPALRCRFDPEAEPPPCA